VGDDEHARVECVTAIRLVNAPTLGLKPRSHTSA
jgi:hypothetical protein